MYRKQGCSYCGAHLPSYKLIVEEEYTKLICLKCWNREFGVDFMGQSFSSIYCYFCKKDTSSDPKLVVLHVFIDEDEFPSHVFCRKCWEERT